MSDIPFEFFTMKFLIGIDMQLCSKFVKYISFTLFMTQKHSKSVFFWKSYI